MSELDAARRPRASIIVNNYNYARFLRASIESALGQTYPNTEVIVVDDGSTDDSRAIIRSYVDRVTPVLQPNGGQGSAFNRGFVESTGEVVVFLDADDMLRPMALAEAIPLFDDPELVKVQWQLTVVNAEGRRTRRLIPPLKPPSGDLRETALRRGPDVFRWPPTSGNAWRRSYLEQILPVPDKLYDNGVDNRLFQLAPFFGRIATLPSSQSDYRLHGANDSRTLDFHRKLRRQLAFYADYSALALLRCEEKGWKADPEVWKENSWWCRLERAVGELEGLVPATTAFLLVDEGRWGLHGTLGERPVVPFTARAGQYWGLPENDTAAVEEFARARAQGASFMVFAWDSFWVLDHFCGLEAQLRSSCNRVLSNERLIVFELTR